MEMTYQRQCTVHKVSYGLSKLEYLCDITTKCINICLLAFWRVNIYAFSLYRFTSNSFDNGLGFKLEYESINVTQWNYSSEACGGSFTAANGLLTSPTYPPTDGRGCIYKISQPTSKIILLNFLSMNISTDRYCSRKYLEIRDGPSENSPLVGKFCDKEIPAHIQSSQNHIWMK